VDEGRLEQDLDRAIGSCVRVFDVVPLRRDRRGTEHLKVRGGLELLAGHRLFDGDLEWNELLLGLQALLRLTGRCPLNRRRRCRAAVECIGSFRPSDLLDAGLRA
jgi:hypothetical protein